MRWHRAAVSVCAAVAVLAGTVTAVTGAIAADQDSARPAGATGDSPGTAQGTSSPYQSSVTITLDTPTGSCAAPPAADPAEPRPSAPCAVVGLPVGASEEDVLRALGKPQQRRTLGEGSEAWDYSRYVDNQRYATTLTILRLEGHRLVDVEKYVFK